MDNKITMRLTFVILGLFLTSLSARSQAKFDKLYLKAEEKYSLGDYKGATEILESFRAKTESKLGKENKYTLQYLMTRARYALALGMIMDFDTYINRGIKFAAGTQSTTPESYAVVLIDAAELLNWQTQPIHSREVLDEASKILTGSGLLKDDYRARINLNKAECMTEQGYYREAVGLLRSEASFFQRRNNKTEAYSDAQGQTKTRRLDDNELQKRYREYARWLTGLAHAYARQGKGDSADSAYVAAGTWINKNLGSISEEYVRNEILFADKLVDYGLAATAEFPQHAGYFSAYQHITSKKQPSHLLAMEATERQLRWLLYQGETKSFLSTLDAYQDLVEKEFPKGCLHQTSSDAVRFNVQTVQISNSNTASEAILMLSKSPNLPRRHPLSADVYLFLYKLSILQKNYRGAQDHLRKVIDIRESLYGKEAPETHLARLLLANYLLDYTNNIKEAEQIYHDSYDQVVSREIGPWQKDHLDILNHLGILYEYTDHFDRADQALARALDVAESKFGRSDPLFAVELTLVANLRMKLGQYQLAEREIKEAIENLTSRRKEPEWKVAYVNALQAQAKLNGLKGQFSEAEEILEETASIIKKSAGENLAFDELASARELSSLYVQLGRYAETEVLLERLIGEYVRSYGQKGARLIEPLVNKGYLYLAKGEYPAAERIALQANDIAVAVYTEKSTKTALVQRLLSDIQFTLGDYGNAEQYLIKALESQEAQFGRDHIEVAKTLAQLGLIRYSKGEKATVVEKPLAEARAIIAEQLGTDNPQYADVLKSSATVYIAEKKYPEALSVLSQAESIWSKKTGTNNNIRAASIFALTGDVYYQIKQYTKAEEFYNRGRKIFEESFSRNHPEYVKITSKLSRIYYQIKDYKKSKKYIEESLANYETYIKQYFPALSEREKAKYWNTIRGDFEFYYTLAFSQTEDFRDLTGKVYNYQLITKALLLNSSLKIKERILSSNNDELKKTYNLWAEKKELLTKALSMNSSQLAAQEIDPNLLSAETERLEKELSERSELFGQNLETRQVVFENVQKSLAPNEVAMEIIRYRHFNHNFTDSVIYVALYLKPNSVRPEIVVFPKGNLMEKRNYNYYRNTIIDQIEDKNSYDIYWAPIQNKLGPQVTNVYLSPDGVYNQINLESIALPKNEGNFLIDQVNIILVNNTKDLYLKKIRTKLPSSNRSAILFGNPEFYTNPESERVYPDLIGTEQEIQEINTLLTGKGWDSKKFTLKNATEEQIKTVNNPRIFHIATHGFYAPAVERNVGDEITGSDNTLTDNPLLKSGLLLRSGGDILSRKDQNYNSADGILTAYEAMNLNLDNTDLVVLSACETGLGEVSSGEGVYGLQRAFLIAGAKVLIMSMFQVDDEATLRLITNFYEKWLLTGNLRQSFKEAKLDLRREFPEPIYWGSFMMVGLE